MFSFFFFIGTATTEIYTLSLHDALPICTDAPVQAPSLPTVASARRSRGRSPWYRSEEHTSELQSRFDLVCRLMLEKKNKEAILDVNELAKGQKFPRLASHVVRDAVHMSA